ncbi:hypothetical protein DPMN_081916 [Dreissena polymorpha]|uniref:Uncharacterized protein n=1 Tax=Dreissena polymorpha TaxID=45954 RepID=A0A9D4B9N0_DREPO|nr:hypothetical protein DPMN_081916 [Dreissena polymorpha]
MRQASQHRHRHHRGSSELQYKLKHLQDSCVSETNITRLLLLHSRSDNGLSLADNDSPLKTLGRHGNDLTQADNQNPFITHSRPDNDLSLADNDSP